MTDQATAGMSRRQLLGAAGTAAAIAAVGLVGHAEAAQPVVDMIPLKVTLTGPDPDFFIIPMTPPLVAGRVSLTGKSDLMGQLTYLDAHTGHMGLDGNFKRVTDGMGVLTGDNGDALFFDWDGLVRPTGVEATFTITGGKGRFVGATGDGIMTNSYDPVKHLVTWSYDGTIAVPKK